MNHKITIREALAKQDVERFWKELHLYHARDIFPDPDDENRAYFLNDTEYRAAVEKIRNRAQDRCYYLFFCRDGQEIGFALPALFPTEDGKCFIMEFCVFPPFRGCGAGHSCAAALLAWARQQGAAYAELNCGGSERRRRFWKSVGFRPNGVDEWGEPLMLLPPAEQLPITVEAAAQCDWQLLKLENGFRTEIGEGALPEQAQARLRQAVQDGLITFFLAKRGCRTVGMCSVATAFSTFACADVGTFEDFYIEPAFRGQGIARLLARAAQQWCADRGISSLTVCCAPCDEGLYRSLGFSLHLGAAYAHINE